MQVGGLFKLNHKMIYDECYMSLSGMTTENINIQIAGKFVVWFIFQNFDDLKKSNHKLNRSERERLLCEMMYIRCYLIYFLFTI